MYYKFSFVSRFHDRMALKLQERMQDPHVAADGFTYEAEALRGWLASGHETSPVTNLELAHKELIPNRVLKFAIQEWLQQ